MSNKRFINGDTLDSSCILHNNENLSDILNCLPESGKNGSSVKIDNEDANNIINNGFYYGNNLKNTPKIYGYLIVVRHFTLSNTDYLLQLFFPQNSHSTVFYMRQKSVEWGPWISISGTVVSS